MEYIDSSSRSFAQNNKPAGCIFCAYPKECNDDENLIITKGRSAFVIMNRYPYSTGHLLVVPYRHTSIFSSLTNEEKLEIFSLAQHSVSVLEKIMHTDGFNLGINIGKAAGAGIDTHIHLHVVPRWNGDINFMSVTAETKVLPEALKVTQQRLLAEWNKTITP
ncbi:MAG: HIT domain-containing protein [Synergistaceae bacterium]|nr:HIT domain-containing protein [Synergistaceae bacterium]